MTQDGPTAKTAYFNSSPKTVLDVLDLEKFQLRDKEQDSRLDF